MESNFEKIKGMTYIEAKKLLIELDVWKYVEDQDGYTIVDYACYLRDIGAKKPKLEDKQIESY